MSVIKLVGILVCVGACMSVGCCGCLCINWCGVLCVCTHMRMRQTKDISCSSLDAATLLSETASPTILKLAEQAKLAGQGSTCLYLYRTGIKSKYHQVCFILT